MKALKCLTLLSSLILAVNAASQDGRTSKPGTTAPAIPKTWDDQALATLQVPLAKPVGSPKQVSADYYYKIPVRPIYKQYPIYAPGHEPPGYVDWLKEQEPVVMWDDKDHAPSLSTQADWIKAGEIAFDAPLRYGTFTVSDVRSAEWYEKAGVPVTKDGILPFFRYVIRAKGNVEIGWASCATCHTRVMPDGTALKGAQGNMPFDRAAAYTIWPLRLSLEATRLAEWSFSAVPWLDPDPISPVGQMNLDQIASLSKAIPGGVLARFGSSVFYPPQIPDLIGVKDRKYLDRTGLQQQRSVADLMRYAALNQGADSLASYDGFVPVDIPNFKKLPDPADPRVGGRYGDEQLYALALYVYSLQPPPNPNKFDAVAQQGQKIFERERCVMCHTPPLYTNNRLTPAEGFSVPPDHLKKYDILPISVGTDPNLTLKTRRGTGYYKVPSLKGVWYRNMFGHSGWCATLEDWFDPRRTRDDYVPTGFKPYGAKTYAVKGHPFGLNLSEDDRKALIAFLKIL